MQSVSPKRFKAREHQKLLKWELYGCTKQTWTYTGKTERLLIFQSQHIRKSIGSKGTVFHCGYVLSLILSSCFLFFIVGLLGCDALFLSFISHCSVFYLFSVVGFFYFGLVMSADFFFPLFCLIVPFASSILNHANNCTCFCNISKFTDQFFSLVSLFLNHFRWFLCLISF